MDLLEGLNPAQREAVETVQGPLLILAGPGSGKTRVISHRAAYLIKVCGVSPRHVMAVTFTNKAARELKERLYRLLGQMQEDLTLGTFHAICARILRQEAQHAGLDRYFLIYDDVDQLNIIKRSMEELGLDAKQYAPRNILSTISSLKSQLHGPQESAQLRQSYYDEVVQRVYERYEALLTQSSALDFDDLLLKTVRLFQDKPAVAELYQNRYLHLLVDEFQDTNIAQYVLARQIAGRHRNICVVGDPDQSIYSWRQADIRNILNFEKDYPDAKVVLLEQNYRSAKTVLEAALNVISVNRQRKSVNLWTENPQGEPITLVEAYNEQDEALSVVNSIEELTKAKRYRASDCAVMYRTNAQSRALEETFLRYGMPYKLVGSLRFYERREVKDLYAYLRLIHNANDEVSLARVINVPPRGIGQRTFSELLRWAGVLELSPYYALRTLAESDGDGPFAHPFSSRAREALLSFYSLLKGLQDESEELDTVEVLDQVVEKTRYQEFLLEGGPQGEEKWANIVEFRSVAGEHRHLPPREGLESFLESVALVSQSDETDARADAATLITLHLAKGLEYPVVFIVGLEEGLLPHRRALAEEHTTPAEMEEERRLFYVGMTRAKERLYLLRAFRRNTLGYVDGSPPSRFLADIPKHLITRPKEDRWQRLFLPAKAPALRSTTPTAFNAGDVVRHPTFGEGIVVSCTPTSTDHEVTVAFRGEAGVKRLLLSLAALEKLPPS